MTVNTQTLPGAVWLKAFCFLVLIFIGPATSNLTAQRSKVEITLPAKERLAIDTPQVRASGMVSAKNTAELIRNGFPARLHFVLERWSARSIANEIVASTRWEVIVEYDALKSVYRVVRVTPNRAVIMGEYKDIQGAEARVAEPYKPDIETPDKGERSYYSVTLEVEAMSMSDIDEVRRWIKGELKPAVKGRRNPGTAVTKGVRRFFVKILGGERLRYQFTTSVFTP